MRIYSEYSLPYMKQDKSVHSYSFIKHSRNAVLALFSQFLIGYHGNDDRYNNFDFSFCYVFASSMNVQSFIAIS